MFTASCGRSCPFEIVLASNGRQQAHSCRCLVCFRKRAQYRRFLPAHGVPKFRKIPISEHIHRQHSSVSTSALPGAPGHESTFTCPYTLHALTCLPRFTSQYARAIVAMSYAACSRKDHMLTSFSVSVSTQILHSLARHHDQKPYTTAAQIHKN